MSFKQFSKMSRWARSTLPAGSVSETAAWSDPETAAAYRRTFEIAKREVGNAIPLRSLPTEEDLTFSGEARVVHWCPCGESLRDVPPTKVDRWRSQLYAVCKTSVWEDRLENRFILRLPPRIAAVVYVPANARVEFFLYWEKKETYRMLAHTVRRRTEREQTLVALLEGAKDFWEKELENGKNGGNGGMERFADLDAAPFQQQETFWIGTLKYVRW